MALDIAGAFFFFRFRTKITTSSMEDNFIKEDFDMFELGAFVVVGLVAAVWFIVRWAILDHQYYKKMEEWRENPNFKWNWD